MRFYLISRTFPAKSVCFASDVRLIIQRSRLATRVDCLNYWDLESAPWQAPRRAHPCLFSRLAIAHGGGGRIISKLFSLGTHFPHLRLSQASNVRSSLTGLLRVMIITVIQQSDGRNSYWASSYNHTNQSRKHSMPVLLFQSLLSALSRPPLMWSPAGPMTPEFADTTRDKVELHGVSYINVAVGTLPFFQFLFISCKFPHQYPAYVTGLAGKPESPVCEHPYTMSPIARLSMPRM